MKVVGRFTEEAKEYVETIVEPETIEFIWADEREVHVVGHYKDGRLYGYRFFTYVGEWNWSADFEEGRP